MINMNDRMKKILKRKEKQAAYLEINGIVTEIVNKTKTIKDCIIYDEDGMLEEDRINFNNILKMFGDWTGYEVSCNEIRFSQKLINASGFLILADKLSCSLAQKYAKNIVVYIMMYSDEIELRFHTYREGDKLWLDEDLNKYNIPILCLISVC